jgi:hypothetical protein
VPDGLGPDGQLWSACDRTVDTGVKISGNPAAWSPPDGVLHVYVPSNVTA